MQVWETEWVKRMTLGASSGDLECAHHLWLWLQREGWGLIPGAKLTVIGSKVCSLDLSLAIIR